MSNGGAPNSMKTTQPNPDVAPGEARGAPLDLEQFAGFTPGPLTFDGCGISLDGRRILTASRAGWDGVMVAYGPLLAAAPALLEECRRLRDENARLSTRLAAAESLIYDAYEDCSDDDEVRALIEQREKDEAARAARRLTGNINMSNPTQQSTPPMTVSLAYDIHTPGSAELGDYAETGLEVEPRVITPVDVMEALELHDIIEDAVEALIPFPDGYVGSRGDFEDTGSGDTFASRDSSYNYLTGESTRYTIHLGGWPLSLLKVARRILTGK